MQFFGQKVAKLAKFTKSHDFIRFWAKKHQFSDFWIKKRQFGEFFVQKSSNWRNSPKFIECHQFLKKLPSFLVQITRFLPKIIEKTPKNTKTRVPGF